MAEGNVTTTIITKLLDWPFLFFLIVVVFFLKFRAELGPWLKRLTEVEVSSSKLYFKIGKDEVAIDKLDDTITARLRELQEEIEALRSANNSSIPITESESTVERNKIPLALENILVGRVYPMLRSNLWLGRYVTTLAHAASVSEETMLAFCKSRSDIGLFEDGNRWVAALSERLNRHTGAPQMDGQRPIRPTDRALS
jgi:hypothetical protein